MMKLNYLISMKTLGDILSDYCGCFGPALNDKTETFTSSGVESYEYLKGFISSLGDLNVLKSNEVIEKLDKIAGRYMPDKCPDSIKSDSNELLKRTKGKKLYSHDSWDGSSMTIVVEKVELLNDSALFTGKNHWGGTSGIYVELEYLKELLDKGCASRHNTIERCDVVTSWKIN